MTERVGVVVIGRNEGDRLLACLSSVSESGCPVVYVDSGSADGSVGKAGGRGVAVVALDPAKPFSAARARNEGFHFLVSRHPEIEFLQFIDGDCTLLPGWIPAAVRALQADARRGVVVGLLHERRPDASVYNRLCALEWRSPPGDLNNFGALGGIMMVRAQLFRQLGGFNEEVVAGEDSEYGVRVGGAGFTITKIVVPMATHDADIHRFAQWWRRAVRSGHAIGQRFSLHGRGPTRDCARDRRSVMFWAIVLPAAMVALAPASRGLSLLLIGAYVVLGHRIARYRRLRGDSSAEARLYARFLVISKFAEAWGLLRFYWNSVNRKFRIIEYK